MSLLIETHLPARARGRISGGTLGGGNHRVGAIESGPEGSAERIALLVVGSRSGGRGALTDRNLLTAGGPPGGCSKSGFQECPVARPNEPTHTSAWASWASWASWAACTHSQLNTPRHSFRGSPSSCHFKPILAAGSSMSSCLPCHILDACQWVARFAKVLWRRADKYFVRCLSRRTRPKTETFMKYTIKQVQPSGMVMYRIRLMTDSGTELAAGQFNSVAGCLTWLSAKVKAYGQPYNSVWAVAQAPSTEVRI